MSNRRVSPGPAFKVVDPEELARRAALGEHYRFHPPATATAPLDPDTFRHQEPESVPGEPFKLNISQKDRPLTVRPLHTLHVACECGRPLCGLEEQWIVDPLGCAIHLTGVCLSCGVQKVMYLSAPKVAPAALRETQIARLQADVTRYLLEIQKLNALDEGNESTTEQETDTWAPNADSDRPECNSPAAQ